MHHARARARENTRRTCTARVKSNHRLFSHEHHVACGAGGGGRGLTIVREERGHAEEHARRHGGAAEG